MVYHHDKKYIEVWQRLDGGSGEDGRDRTVEHILNIQVHIMTCMSIYIIINIIYILSIYKYNTGFNSNTILCQN